MNTDNEKNISLILKQENEEPNENITISLSTIFRQCRRILSLWIVLAVLSGLVSVSFTMFLNKSVQSDIVTSLVCFNYQGAANGLAPDGSKFDVNKIKAPSIIETALTNLDLPLDYVEPIRRNIEIKGVIPSEAMDKITLYHDIYATGGTAGLEAVNSLLEIGYNPTYYIINFDNVISGFDIEMGKKIIDEVLIAYQDYFFTLYGYNKALGNSVAAIDYTEYDYPAAVDIFKGIYDELDRYIINLQNYDDSVGFRSNETGYSFSDIRRSVRVLRGSDLDALSSYITINNISKDMDQLITYYEYRIEQLERDEKVLSAELKALTNSIDTYEKDELLIFGETTELEGNNYSQVSQKYDEMIEQKVSVKEQHANKQQEIEYYKSRLKTFKESKSDASGDTDYVDEKFANLYDKTKELIEITTKTSDEYYENVVFANAFNILVPSSGDANSVEMGSIIIPVLIIEALVFMGCFGYAFVSAIIIDVKKGKQQKANEEEPEA